MDKPDLHALAADLEGMYDAVERLIPEIDDAYNAALGESVDDDHEDIIPGTASGDNAAYFEEARMKLNEAAISLAQAQRIIATVQGFRDFAESGSVPA